MLDEAVMFVLDAPKNVNNPEDPMNQTIPVWAMVTLGASAVLVVLILFVIIIILAVKLRQLLRRDSTREERARMLIETDVHAASNVYYQRMEQNMDGRNITQSHQHLNPVQYNEFDSLDNDFSPELNRAIVNMSPALKSVGIIAEELNLEEQIGAGSSSVVFKATYMGVTVAVKRCLICDLLEDPLRDFIKETTIMSKLRHQNVVSFLGASIKEFHFYIISEYCENGSLEKLIHPTQTESFAFMDSSNKCDAEHSTTAKGHIQLSLPVKYKVLLDVALGLLYLSKKGVIHRDLKLANLLVDRHWTCKLADFGVSRVMEKGKRMTRVGTIETCAPEVLASEDYSLKSDVYSFGIVMWELLFELPLYPDLNVYEITKQVVEHNMRPPIPKKHKVPAQMIELMQSCWNADKDNRPNFSVCVEVLKQVVDAQGPIVMPGSPQPSSKASRSDLVISSNIMITDKFDDKKSKIASPLTSRRSASEFHTSQTRHDHIFV